jgi:hypothetical protein
MSFSDFKNRSARIRENLRGWRTDRKIIVIESDDWGSIRMPSAEVYNKSLKAGYPLDQTVYERYDCILSQDDLELFFNLLTQFHDKNNNYPIITANCVVANPDFEKIKEGEFQTYHYELITATFKRYPKHQNNFKLWEEGFNKGIFFPQFHAREHLNVSLFMDALRRGDPDIHFAFNNQMSGNIRPSGEPKGNIYMEATRYYSPEDKKQKLAVILEGLDLFEKIFGYKSETVIPTNYIWSNEFNQDVLLKGVKALQGQRRMKEPLGNGVDKNHYHYLGQKSKYGQIYLIRNAIFEPSAMHKMGITDPVDKCLADISIAFRMNKPAIICSHRVNYAGFIDETNRDKTLKMLDQLLRKVLKRWPEIEFMSSSQLADIISLNNNKLT